MSGRNLGRLEPNGKGDRGGLLGYYRNWVSSQIQEEETLTMQRDTVLAILEQHRTSLKALGIRSLSLFGSVARDQANPNSDVDLLVDLEPPLTFDRYMDAKFYLEDQLGTRVDLVSWRSIKPQIRDVIEQEAIHVA